MGKRLLGNLLVAVVAVGSSAYATEDRLIADVNFGFFTGDYGAVETTDVEVITPRLSYVLPRGQLQLLLPLMRVRSGGRSATWVGDGGVFASTVDGGRPRQDETVSGPGDVRLKGELDLLQGTAVRPWITGAIKVKLPTADEDQGLGTGKTDVDAAIGVTQPLGRRCALLADVGYVRMGSPGGYELEDVARLGAGLSISIGGDRPTRIYTYVENRSHPIPGEQDRLDVALGASRRFGPRSRLRFSGATFFGLSGTAEDLGLSLTLGRAF